MLRFTCDLCGKEWAVTQGQNNTPWPELVYADGKRFSFKSPCYLCEEKIDKASKEAAAKAEEAMRQEIKSKGK